MGKFISGGLIPSPTIIDNVAFTIPHDYGLTEYMISHLEHKKFMLEIHDSRVLGKFPYVSCGFVIYNRKNTMSLKTFKKYIKRKV